MLQNILNLNGAQQLSKNELQTIQGGGLNCAGQPDGFVPRPGYICCSEAYCNGTCMLGVCYPE